MKPNHGVQPTLASCACLRGTRRWSAPRLNYMDKLNFENLKQFDLTFPGHWLEGQDRDQAFQISHTLSMIQSLFTEAVASYALFQPLTSEN